MNETLCYGNTLGLLQCDLAMAIVIWLWQMAITMAIVKLLLYKYII